MSSTQAPSSAGRSAVAPRRPLLLAVLALALAGPAAAAPPRISIAPVKGDRSGAVGAQLVSALCSAHRCLPGLVDASRARLARARKRGVEAAVLASVRRAGGRLDLSVTLLSSAGRTLQTWRLPLGRGLRIPAPRLDALAEDVQFILRPGSRSLPPPPPAPLPRRSDPPIATEARPQREPILADEPPQRASLQAWPDAEPRDLEEMPVVTVRRDPSEESGSARPWGSPPRSGPRPSAGGDQPPPFFAADAAIETARHALSFPSTGKKPVGYMVNLYAVPRLRLEGHLLGGLAEELADVGLFSEIAYIPALSVPSESRTMRVSYLRIRGGAHWRMPLESGLVLRPAFALEGERLSVRVDGGARFPRLPDTSLFGPSLGLDLALPLGRSAFTLLAGGRAIWWLAAGELSGGAPFFPGGRALGVEAEAGATMRIDGRFSLGVLVSHATTQWWLDPDPHGEYTVSSARATTWGGRAWVRLQL